MASWGTIKSLLLFVGPMLLPKAISYYKSIRTGPTGKSIRPIPPFVSRALSILFSISVVALISTLPYFSPENIFHVTQSRLQIPTDVLFTRLTSLRNQGLTDGDTVLRQKLVSLESRLLYFQYGPSVISDCQFCKAEDPRSYLYYALPAILAPHLFNLCVLALVTSGLFVGKEGAVWRRTATICSIVLAASEIWMVSSYDNQRNARATRLEDIHAFYWTMRTYRSIAIAGLDALLGWFIYLSSTNRAFVIPLTTSEKLETTTKLLEGMRSKLNATLVVQNTVARKERLRNRKQEYWTHEDAMLREMMEDREVLEGVNNALENRIDMNRITADAETYAQSALSGMHNADGST